MPKFADLGLDSLDDERELHLALDEIDVVVGLRDELRAAGRGKRGSAFDRLVRAMPPSPVPLDVSLPAAWSAVAVSLEQVQRDLRDAITDGRSIFPTVMQTVLRRALLGSARICYVLAPAEHEDRIDHALDIIAQDAYSQSRMYAETSGFTHLTGLKPPAELVANQEELREEFLRKRFGEAELLKRTAPLIEEQLRAAGHEDFAAGQIAEHFAWTFHVYSGVAHAWGWPWIGPRTESAPGIFVAELRMIVSVGHLGLELAHRSLGLSNP